MLPTPAEIKKWDDEKLLSVISSGEKINWNCSLDESQHEVDFYVESVYSEFETRNMFFYDKPIDYPLKKGTVIGVSKLRPFYNRFHCFAGNKQIVTARTGFPIEYMKQWFVYGFRIKTFKNVMS